MKSLSYTPAPKSKRKVRRERNPMDRMIQAKIRELTVEEKVGQLLVVGLSGKSLGPKTIAFLQKIKPGSVILFSRNLGNYSQVRALTDRLQNVSQQYSGLPLLIMIDQEGGVVTRVKVGTSLPSALALAQTRHPDFVRDYSMTMGALLNRLGINMNLAPVLDVSDPNSASFIGSRSFGESPQEVAELGAAFALGQWDAGVIPTAKHFPGHGGLRTDSHKETPRKNLTLSELAQKDLLPFKAFSDLEVPTAMMLGHVSFPKIDSSGYPAAFSKTLNHDLLREQLGYEGLSITDDLEMAGAEKVGSINERTIQAVLAGNDMIMVAWSTKRQLQAFETLVNAVKTGRISEERLNQSLERIFKAKILAQRKAQEFETKEVERLRLKLVDLSKDVKRLSFQSSLRTNDFSKTLPVLGEETLVYSSDPKFFKNFNKAFMRSSRWISLSKKNVKTRIESINHSVPKHPFIFYVSGIGTARWLDRLSAEHKRLAIVINTNQPGAIKNPQDFLKIVHLNSSSPESGAWLAEYLNQSTPVRQPSAEP